jgi:ABC-2 type transport system permease protein
MTAAVLDRTPVHAPTRPATRRASLARLTGLEIRKSLSTRSGRTLTGAAAVLPAAFAGLMFALGEQPPNAAMLLAVLGSLVGMLLIAVGVLSTAGEWTHHTVQTTFLTVPQRSRVVAAKYAGMALLGTAIAVVVVGTTYAVAAVGTDPGFSWQDAWPAALATVATGAALTAVGAGIGAAVANAPAALTGTYLVLLVGMTILNGAKPEWGRNVDPLGATFNLIGQDGGTRAVAVLAGWVLATAVAGAVVTRRRAVS